MCTVMHMHMYMQVPSDCSEQQCHHDELHWPCQSTLGHWLFWLSAVIIGATAYWANGVIEQKGMMRYGQTEWVRDAALLTALLTHRGSPHS